MRIAALLLSPWIQVGRGVWALASIIFILEVTKMVDISTISTPEAFLPYMLIASVIMAVLIGKLTNDTLYHAAIDNKIAGGKIESAAELPPDKRYFVGTSVAIILAIGTGLYMTSYAIDFVGIVNAGQWTFVAFTGIISAVSVAAYILILHWGLREFIVRASDYAVTIAQTVKDSAAKVAEVKAAVSEARDTVAAEDHTADDQLP